MTGKVLVSDRDPPVCPVVTDPAQERHETIAHGDLEVVVLKQAIHQGVGADLVEIGHGLVQAIEDRGDRHGCEIVIAGPLQALLGEDSTTGFRCGDSPVPQGDHGPSAPLVARTVETISAGRARRIEQAVPTLPGAQRVAADAEPAFQLADPQSVENSAHRGDDRA